MALNVFMLVPQLNKHIVLLLIFLCSVGHFMMGGARKPRDLVPVIIDYRVLVITTPHDCSTILYNVNSDQGTTWNRLPIV